MTARFVNDKKEANSMKYTIEHTELSRMLEDAARQGASRALEAAGIAKPTITKAKIKAMYSQNVANKARMSDLINWIPIGKGGKTSGEMCLRSEFDKFLTTNQIEAVKKPTNKRKSHEMPCM